MSVPAFRRESDEVVVQSHQEGLLGLVTLSSLPQTVAIVLVAHRLKVGLFVVTETASYVHFIQVCIVHHHSVSLKSCSKTYLQYFPLSAARRLRFHHQGLAEMVILPLVASGVTVTLLPATIFKILSAFPLKVVTAVPPHLMVKVLFAVELVVPEMVMVPSLDETETPFLPVILTLFETEFQSFRIK